MLLMGALLIVDIEWHYGLIQPLLNPISYPPSLHIFTHSQMKPQAKNATLATVGWR